MNQHRAEQEFGEAGTVADTVVREDLMLGEMLSVDVQVQREDEGRSRSLPEEGANSIDCSCELDYWGHHIASGLCELEVHRLLVVPLGLPVNCGGFLETMVFPGWNYTVTLQEGEGHWERFCGSAEIVD